MTEGNEGARARKAIEGSRLRRLARPLARLLPLALGLAALPAAGCGLRGALFADEGKGPASLRMTDAEFAATARETSREEALADLERALEIFENAYPGPDGGSPLPDPAEIEAARARIAERASWPAPELARLLCDLFRQPDGHLSWELPGPHPTRLHALEEPESEGALAASAVAAPDRALLGSPGRSLAAGEASPPSVPALETLSRASGFAAPALFPVETSKAAVALQEGEVPVLKIRTFDAAAEAALVELPAIAERLRTRRAFVVDLRGNRGGNYAFAEAFVLSLTDAPLRALEEREILSVAAAEGRENRVRQRLHRGEVPPAAVPRFLAHRDALRAQAEALRSSGTLRTEVEARGRRVAGRAAAPLRGTAVLLVDRGCASACEMMVALARQIPGVVVAGDRTRGAFAVGEIALFRLPHSGINVSLGTRAFSDPLGEFDDRRGFHPDITLPDRDALRRAIALARESARVPASPASSDRPQAVGALHGR